MEFKDAKEVKATLAAGEEVRCVRSVNRAKIDTAVNGLPYISLDESKKQGCNINANMGEMVVLAARARGQYEQGLLGPENFCRITLRKAPDEFQAAWSEFITDKINRPMKESEEYDYLIQYQIGALVNHGIGIQHWCDRTSWAGEFVSIDDLFIPTDTLTSFKGLPWFGVRNAFTEGELSERVFGQEASKKWNKEAIKKILDRYHKISAIGQNTGNVNWLNQPEKMADLVKQSAGFYSSDAVKTIPLVNFYYRVYPEGKKPYWKLCVVPDYETGYMGEENTEDFLYDSGEEPVADDISQLLNVQFGDLNSKAPFMYHAIRSLGSILFEPCFWKNFTMCRQIEHLIESFNVWLKNQDPSGKARAKMVNLFNKSVLPEGVTIVPQNERHQVNPNLIEMVNSQLKQLQAEASMSYTQSVDTGTSKEQTAFETHVKLSQVNAIMAVLLGRAFKKRKASIKESCRRFCIKDSDDEDVKEFQRACEEEGIPREYLNVKLWDIECEIPMGSGNQTMAMAMAQQIMAASAKFDPYQQRLALHEYVEAITGQASKAKMFVPMKPQVKVSSATEYAIEIFGALMAGAVVPIKEGLPLSEQIDTLMGMLAGVVAQANEMTNFTGVQMVLKFIEGLIQQMSEDQSEGERVAKYGKDFQVLSQEAQQAAQAIQKQKEAGNVSPEVQASAQAIAQDSQVKNKIAFESHQADMQRKAQDFQMKAKMDSESHQLDSKIKISEAKLGAQTEMATTSADVQAVVMKAQAEVKALMEKTAATIAAMEIKAKAQAEAAKKQAEARPAPSTSAEA